ncbi:hypothetical protein HPB49_016128 [Dermacentor silvarum]|uniref:Uncharacterized protein n=1 Tax=Dermacentor silvarum TaxID=543639 RepID=A0ACB8CFY6_DERSI|nr:hypothetical protein HPB49_016128 [Dermacentor silvarum]
MSACAHQGCLLPVSETARLRARIRTFFSSARETPTIFLCVGRIAFSSGAPGAVGKSAEPTPVYLAVAIIDEILQPATTGEAFHKEAVHVQGTQCDASEMRTPPIEQDQFEEVTQAGCKASKFFRALRCVGVACSSDKTHFRVQNAFLIPAVTKVWTNQQNVLFDEAIGRPLRVAGDGRADSPGHSAKYGTYSLLDIELNKSNETKGSNHMELEGLKRTLQICEANGLEISTLFTERPSQIKAFTSKETSIEHNFDCWHVAKMLKKKLTAAAKLKKFQELAPWIPAVVNHLYWCALSSRAQPD